MGYQDQWNAHSNRIRGLMEAAQLHSHYLSLNSVDHYGMAKRLSEHGQQVLSALQTFQNCFEHSLPPRALDSIDRFLTNTQDMLNDTSGGLDAQQQRLWAALVFLGAFEAEMSFLLSDVQQRVRVGSEPTPAAPSDSGDIIPLWKVERDVIERAIDACDGNIPEAAAKLGVSPSTIYRKKLSWESEEGE